MNRIPLYQGENMSVSMYVANAIPNEKFSNYFIYYYTAHGKPTCLLIEFDDTH